MLLEGRRVTAIAPEPNDLVAAKLARGNRKDVVFARICLGSGLVKHDLLKQRIEFLLEEPLLTHALNKLAQATCNSKGCWASEADVDKEIKKI